MLDPACVGGDGEVDTVVPAVVHGSSIKLSAVRRSEIVCVV
jgi:hypothetical protein